MLWMLSMLSLYYYKAYTIDNVLLMVSVVKNILKQFKSETNSNANW